MKTLLLTFLATLSVAGGGGQSRAEANVQMKLKCPLILNEIKFYRTMTWAWQDENGTPRTRFSKYRMPSCEYARWVAEVWMHRSHVAFIKVKKMIDKRIRKLDEKTANLRELQSAVSEGELTSDWACIHSYEGDWDDPNPPYWGGLQMDMNFQRVYGAEFLARWGTADNWPVWAQVTAANRGKADSGYAPWPKTARMCGLL